MGTSPPSFPDAAWPPSSPSWAAELSSLFSLSLLSSCWLEDSCFSALSLPESPPEPHAASDSAIADASSIAHNFFIFISCTFLSRIDEAPSTLNLFFYYTKRKAYFHSQNHCKNSTFCTSVYADIVILTDIALVIPPLVRLFRHSLSLLPIFHRRHPCRGREAGHKVLALREPCLLRDFVDQFVRLPQQPLGLLNP